MECKKCGSANVIVQIFMFDNIFNLIYDIVSLNTRRELKQF